MSEKRILLTGSGGFVGSNLISAFKSEYYIAGLDTAENFNPSLKEFHTWDELDNIPGFDAVIHLAGKAHDTGKTADAKSYFDVNVGLTKRIFEYFLGSTSSRFILFSSVKAVTDSPGRNIVDENFTPDPKTPYGESKLAAEQYVAEQVMPAGKSVYILRPCMIHGPNNKGNLNTLYNYCLKGYPYPLGSCENRRSYLSFKNLVYLLKGLMEMDVPAGVYNMADDDPVSTVEIVDLIAESLKRSPLVWKIPGAIFKVSAKAGDLFNLPFNSDSLGKLTGNYILSNSKIKKALGISGLPVSSRDGLLMTFESMNK